MFINYPFNGVLALLAAMHGDNKMHQGAGAGVPVCRGKLISSKKSC
jgi:hypothetical protein